MKTLKFTILLCSLFAFTMVNAQEKKKKAAKDKPIMKEKQFSKLDANADNVIDLTEMKSFFSGKTTKNGKPFKVEKMFTRKDKNNDGQITLEEFSTNSNKNANQKKGKGKQKKVKSKEVKTKT